MIPFFHFLVKEITFKASFSYTDDDFRSVVDMFKAGPILPNRQLQWRLLRDFAGTFKNVERLVTSRILLEDVVKKGFEELVTNTNSHIKILVTPIHDNLAHS